MLRTWRNIMAIRSYTEHPLTCLIWAKTLMEGRPRDNFTRNQGSLNCFQWSLMLVLVEHGNGLSLMVVKLSGSARRSARTSSPSHTVVIAQSVYRSPTGSQSSPTTRRNPPKKTTINYEMPADRGVEPCERA